MSYLLSIYVRAAAMSHAHCLYMGELEKCRIYCLYMRELQSSHLLMRELNLLISESWSSSSAPEAVLLAFNSSFCDLATNNSIIFKPSKHGYLLVPVVI